MTVTWAIELDSEPVERVRADLLVAPLFEGDRPLRGAASRIDWRLCGHLSEMLARGAFRGAPGEVVLVPTATACARPGPSCSGSAPGRASARRRCGRRRASPSVARPCSVPASWRSRSRPRPTRASPPSAPRPRRSSAPARRWTSGPSRCACASCSRPRRCPGPGRPWPSSCRGSRWTGWSRAWRPRRPRPRRRDRAGVGPAGTSHRLEDPDDLPRLEPRAPRPPSAKLPSLP